jgi:hypothetical protein
MNVLRLAFVVNGKGEADLSVDWDGFLGRAIRNGEADGPKEHRSCDAGADARSRG